MSATLSLIPCEVKTVTNLQKDLPAYDAILIVDREPAVLTSQFNEYRSHDNSFDNEVSCFYSPQLKVKVIYAPTGPLDDFDDVRVYERAAEKAIQRALKAGSQAPLLVLPNVDASNRYKYAALATLLGSLHKLYVPIQLREDVPAKRQLVKVLGVYSENEKVLQNVLKQALTLEQGKFVARDLGGGDPERMAPPRVADYVRDLFANSKKIQMTVISDASVFEKDFPLFQAVNRAAASVARHNGRIIILEYKPPKPAVKSLFLVGKGVTYDTGGADIKAGGVMAGMSRDKCGAAAVAGFMKFVEQVEPENVHIFGVLCMVRNSVGEECYVSDEVITAKSGVRVRVGNTDAEGRMCMADALYLMKERALTLPDPHLFTIATLTGHAFLAVGEGYSICMDNGPARDADHGHNLKKYGDQVGNPFEISTIQREDFNFHTSSILGEDVIQANNIPSSRTPRGHQGPAAFMMLVSGIDKHGSRSAKPLKYSHIDIAGSAGEFPHTPTGAPIRAFAATHLDYFK